MTLRSLPNPLIHSFRLHSLSKELGDFDFH